MQNPQNPGPSGRQPSSSQPFLQDSSLMTQMPPEHRTQEPPTAPLKADQKILSPTRPILAQLDSRGSIQINITVPASALTLVKLLGEGAYGSVYEGLWNDQAVAIKRLKAQHLTEKAIEELRQEAQIMFQLGVESKYIVPLKKICLEAPHYSLVMELMPKGSLYHLLHNGQDLPWAIRFQIALDAAWGLKDLHGYSILHRDLKSLNILLDDRLRAKLADFGLAKVKQETSSQSTIAKGTVLWMAPELFKRKAEVTEAADIWSLGMVLWELASREIPFKDAQNQLQAMGWIKDGEKEEIPSDCPAELKPIIESCWDLMPSQRPTVIQVVERLKRLVTSDEKQKLSQPVFSSVEGQPKPGVTADSKDDEMKKLLNEVMRLKLEKEKEARRRLQAEKKWEDHARQQAELERRRAEKLKEIQRQPVEPKDKLPLTPSKKEQELKKLTPLPSLSGNLQPSFLPPPKPTLKPLDQKSLSQLQQLLQFVAEGEQSRAEALIQTDKNLLLYAGTVKDLSGREFKPITAFQYALWAMDWHMWTMIQKYLPQEAQAEQLRELETKGTAYGKHFNLQGLTGALQTYVDNAAKWKYDQRAYDQWCKVVGGEQKLLPAHVVNEYCRADRPFEPCPQEWESKLPRTRKMNVWDSTQSKTVKGSWFIAPSSKDSLGLNFAFYKHRVSQLWGGGLLWGSCGRPLGAEGLGMVGARGRTLGRADLRALQSLWKTRTQQLEVLKSQLSSTAGQNQIFGA
jgi:serine/threonine protein kinase